MNCRAFPRTLALATLAMQAAAPQYAADVVRLTLTDAVHLAISQNRALKIARLKVTEKEHRKAGERSAYFPAGTALHVASKPLNYIPDSGLSRRHVLTGHLVPDLLHSRG
jgi:outer membrane protein TolC